MSELWRFSIQRTVSFFNSCKSDHRSKSVFVVQSPITDNGGDTTPQEHNKIDASASWEQVT